jgi:hypothetical protein
MNNEIETPESNNEDDEAYRRRTIIEIDGPNTVVMARCDSKGPYLSVTARLVEYDSDIDVDWTLAGFVFQGQLFLAPDQVPTESGVKIIDPIDLRRSEWPNDLLRIWLVRSEIYGDFWAYDLAHVYQFVEEEWDDILVREEAESYIKERQEERAQQDREDRELVQLNTPPALHSHGYPRTNWREIMIEHYIYKGCEIEIYQNTRSNEIDRPTYFAIPALPYGKTGKKFTRRALGDSESLEETKRFAEAHVDQWETRQAI